MNRVKLWLNAFGQFFRRLLGSLTKLWSRRRTFFPSESPLVRARRLPWAWIVPATLLLIMVISAISWYRQSHDPNQPKGFSLTSSEIIKGSLPTSATCAGADLNPSFNFNHVPSAAKSLAIIATESDRKSSQDRPNNYNWLVFNIPPSFTTVTEGIRPPGTITRNWKGNFNYNGPCPGKGKSVTVTFKLYALDVALLPVNASSDQAGFESIIKGHVISQTTLTASYKQSK